MVMVERDRGGKVSATALFEVRVTLRGKSPEC